MFEFLGFDCLTDGEITLLLSEKAPADEAKGYVPAYKYTIIKNGFPAGKCDVRIGDNENTWYGGHIGYEVFPEFRGRHYAAKACRLLSKVARAHGMTRVYISCNPENTASRKNRRVLRRPAHRYRRFALGSGDVRHRRAQKMHISVGHIKIEV